MSGRIDIPVGLNASGVARGAKDAERSMEELADAVEDTGKGGARDLDALEDELKAVQRQSERTEKAVDDVGGKGFHGAKQAAGEFKQEALSNFSEVTSSFDGSMSSIQDLAQGTLGGLASTDLPGVGIAAGIAATAVGLIGAGFAAAEEQRKKLQERANDLAQAYIEAGSTVLGAMTVADRAADILTDPERRAEAEKLAEALGGDMALAVRLLAGDTDALAEAQTKAAAAQEYLESLNAAQRNTTGKRKTELDETVKAYEGLIAVVGEQSDVQRNAAETARIQSDIYIDLINSTQGVKKEVDEFGNALYSLPTGETILINADTGQASANVEAFKGDVDGIKENVTTTVRAELDTSGIYAALAGSDLTVKIRGRIFTRDGTEVF